MAAIDKLGIINIIDKHFDALNGEYSPYVIEGNSTVFSFFKKLYDILKDGSIFENNLLLKTYEETIKEILVKLEQIENRKIYQYNFANSSDINDIKNSFTEMLKYLWKYVDRHFPQTLTENEQKVGYYNKNFGYHIEKEIEVEHTEESYEQISNEELQAGPQQGEEYYVHPIASTEIEYNPVTELEPQQGVEYYTNPVVSTREDYSLTQDSEPQPGAEYYVRSIIETIEIYNLAEESEPKADETYYTHPINEREVYTEESEPQAGVEYYVHPTVEREVYNLVQDKSSVSLPYNEYYKHGYRPLTSEEIAAGLKQGYEYFKEITVETPSGYTSIGTTIGSVSSGSREFISEFELVDKTQTLKPEPGKTYFRKLEPDDPQFAYETYVTNRFNYGPDGLEFKDDVDYYVLTSISSKKYLRLSSDGIHYEPIELVPYSDLSPFAVTEKKYTKIDTSVITEPDPNTVYYAYNKNANGNNANPEFAPIEEIVEYPAGSLTEWDTSNGNEYYTKEIYNIYNADRPTTTTTTEIVPVDPSELVDGFDDNVAYYTYDENTHVPCTENDFDITTSESEVPSVVYERVTTEEKEKLYNVMDDVRALEDIYGYEIYKKVDNEYVRVTEEDLENYPNNPNSKWYNYPDPDLHMIGLKLDETFYKKISINYNERGLIPIDKSTYSQPITKESISKIYVNPLPEEGIRYVDNTATITRIPATSFEQYEAQYGRPIYKLVDGEYVPIESGDMVKNEDNGAWYLDPQYTYFSKETRTLPYFRESTEDDFDYTGDFENASFKEDRNYRYLNGLEVASGYIERGEKYSTLELYTRDLRFVLYADFYTNSFYEAGYFDESDRDVYYEVENKDGLHSRYLGETLFNKLYQSSDLVTYEKATTPDENIFKVLKNFDEWFRYNGSEYISSSTFLDEPAYISLSTLSVSGAYVLDGESYRLVTEDDVYEDKLYKLDISKQYYFHELTFENNRYGQKLFEMSQNLLPTTTTTTETTFKEDMDYYTKSQVEELDTSSYVLAENLEEGIPYFTKTIVKEVVDDSSYVPAGDLQSFDDDIDYFTKTIAYTYDDSSYEPAGNLQSFDENTQYFNKIVTNTYDTSSYVPAENLQVFDDGASYFTKSITYTYDDSSYEPITDLQSFNENTDYFTKKITVVTETQTISTYESDDGTELKFNGYKEDIIIGGKLLPIYNENGKVEYDNDVYIKMLGVDKVYPEIIVRLSKNEEYKYYNLNDAILTIFKNDNYKKFSTNDVDSKNVLIEYSFDNGFVVNDNNEYESPNGLIYELFLSALRSIVDSSRNYFMEKLKKYFYDGIVSRYREKKIEDKRTSLVIRDDGLNSNDMMVIPKVYEKLGGKGGSIGSITTLDFDKKTNFDSSEYIRMVFDDAYYNTKTNNIELYFDLSYMNGFIKSLSNYRGIDGFINNYAMRFDKDANIRQWLLINKKEIEEAILKNLLFAIEPCFWPDYTNDESWNKNFYVNNAAKLQKVYYYNNKTYSKEDELLKDLNLSETNKKFVEYSVIRKQRNISIDFDNDKFIILLKNEDRLTIDKELFDENDSYFERNTISNEEYNEKVADYFEKLNLEKLYLGSGYINVRKVPQKFKDNGVSELVDCEYVNKNVFNESEEFSSILDDREFIILHNVNTKVSNGNNVFYDTEGNYSDIEFPYELEGSVQTIPIWKSAKLYKKKHYFELVCSNFMKKNNIEAIKQIRVMQPTNNKNRYLFNVRSIENRTTEEKGILFDINFKDLEDYKISYVLNNTLHIPNQSVLSTGINEDTLRLSSLPDNEKFDYYSDSSLRITYGDEKFPSEEQYVFGDTMYIKSPSNIVEEEELLILAERSKEYKVFTSEYIMILEPGLETNKLNIADGEYINVQILDFLQVSPGAINVELPQLVYDNEGNGSVYVKTVEPEPLIFRGFYKKFELIDSSPSLLVERRNMVNFNINKQNLTIKKDLNKKITFKENLKFSKQMALRIFDESPKLELFENKWLKCKRLNGSLECKVSNMGELQFEKIERVYLEFSEFSDRNTVLEVIFLPEEARLINSVIKLLPNNYTFRNDKNAVYIYDSNGNSVDTLYKDFYLDCDVLKQGEKIIEGEKFIEFEFRPSREYFNGTDRWMQLINNQPYVIPLIEGMDQELKKFEVVFH